MKLNNTSKPIENGFSVNTVVLFWGTAIFTLGIASAVFQYLNISLDAQFYWQYWSLLLILWGIMYIVKDIYIRTVLTVLSAILFGFLISTVLYFPCTFDKHIEHFS